tara:strand:+ start:154 stop:771 length:618 start_codon:yes stop_codon:yes gene_type:complete
MNNFDKNNYVIVKEAINKKVAEFVFKYFLNKKKVADYLFAKTQIYSTLWGCYDDTQIPNTYCAYGDMTMDTLLQICLPIIEKNIDRKILPTYSYARLYKKGDRLNRHKDRFSCEISTTLNLGGDKWAIFIEPNKNVSPVKITLESGDMLIYKGSLCDHWRNTFEGEVCGQVFLHYNNILTNGSEKNIYDGRAMLGLPKEFYGELK